MTTSLPSACGDGYDGSLDDDVPGGVSDALEDFVPRWALVGAEAELRADLLRAGGDGDTWGADAGVDPARRCSFADTVRALELFDPELLGREAAGGSAAGFADADAEQARELLVAGIVASQRLVNHFQAVQHRWVAALARPGVAVPWEALVDVVTSGGNDVRVPGAGEEDLLGDPARLLDDPAWAVALRGGAAKVAAAEIGPVLSIAPRTASGKVASALDLVDELPAVLAAQEIGVVDGYRVSIIADQTVTLDPQQRATVAEAVLPAASSRTPSRLREILKRKVIAADPDAAQKRVDTARQQRDVTVRPVEDDSGVVSATIGVGDAHLVYAVLDQAARNLNDVGARGSGQEAGFPPRTLAQRRADVFTDIFISLATTGHASIGGACCAESSVAGGARSGDVVPSVVVDDRSAVARRNGRAAAPSGRSAAAVRTTCLNVFLDVDTALGLADDPASIAGMGIITADTARALAASAATVRALIVQPGLASPPKDSPPRGSPPGHSTNPARSRACGTVMDAGRAVYVPPARVADYVTARDASCQWPGCRMAADACDLDHRLPYGTRGGTTCACNLDALCRFHHRLKTFTTWTAIPGDNGSLTWTSPAGRTHPTEPGLALLDEPLPF